MRGAEHIVVVGAGLAGLRTVEALRAAEFPGRISLVGDEPHEPYDRPPLSKELLAGVWTEERIRLHRGDLADLDAELHLGTAAVRADPAAVVLADGTRLRYDRLVVATGVRARWLPGQPAHPDVHVLRTLQDCRALRASLSRARSMLVIGAGFIGAEVASTARGNGVEVTMLEALPEPFARVLGEQMGELCARLQTDHGVALHRGVAVADFLDTGPAGGVAVRLADGTVREADCAVVGVGTAVDAGWLAGLGLPADRALPCDPNGLVAGTHNVYAVGDVAAWFSPALGTRTQIEHWTSATEQAMVVGQRIAGVQISRPADTVPYFWSDQYGLKLQLVGRPALADRVEVLHDPGEVKGTLAGYFDGGNHLVAALAFHSPRMLNRCRALLRDGADERQVRGVLAGLVTR